RISPPAPLIKAAFPANCMDFLLGAAQFAAILRRTRINAEGFAQVDDAAMVRGVLVAYCGHPTAVPGGRGMYTTLTLVDLAGAVALLIWGVHMVQTGVTRAFGPQLRRILSQALDNRLKAFAAGLGVTAILQSSTAT